MVDPAPAARLPELCFVAGVALSDAVLALAPALAPVLALKWPNDLLLDRAKLSGILIESTSAGGITAVAIGIGVNIQHRPADLGRTTASLAEHAPLIDAERLLAALDHAMRARLDIWAHGAGFARIRAAWRERAMGIGEPVVVRTGGRERHGIFEDFDAAGQLILRGADDRLEPVAAGEIFFSEGAR